MRYKLAMILISGLIWIPGNALGHGLDDVLERAADFLGGEQSLTALQQIEITSTGTRWVLDEGFEPGASRQGTFDMDLQWEVRKEQLRLDYDIETPSFGVTRSVIEVVNGADGFTDGQDGNFAPPGTFAMSSDRVESIKRHQRLLNPQVILRELLRDDGDARLRRHHHGLYDQIVIEDNVANITLFILRETGEISHLKTKTSDLLRRDVPLVITYSDWGFFGSGVKFPTQIEISLDGELVHREQRTAVRAGAELFLAEIFSIPDNLDAERDLQLQNRGNGHHQTLQSMAAFGFPQDGFRLNIASTEITPGVWFLGGTSHNSLAVVQSDGVVIVDAPLGPERSRAILDWVKEEIGSRVKNVVVSHHHVDHAAGVREMAGRWAGVVVHESVRDFWNDVFRNPSRILQDAIERKRSWRPYDVRITDYKELVVLEDDNTPVRAFPYEQTHSVDSVLVEAGGVIFVVDTYSPGNAPAPDVGRAIVEAVEAQGLTPSFIAGGHGTFITWADFLAGLPQ